MHLVAPKENLIIKRVFIWILVRLNMESLSHFIVMCCEQPNSNANLRWCNFDYRKNVIRHVYTYSRASSKDGTKMCTGLPELDAFPATAAQVSLGKGGRRELWRGVFLGVG